MGRRRECSLSMHSCSPSSMPHSLREDCLRLSSNQDVALKQVEEGMYLTSSEAADEDEAKAGRRRIASHRIAS